MSHLCEILQTLNAVSKPSTLYIPQSLSTEMSALETSLVSREERNPQTWNSRDNATVSLTPQYYSARGRILWYSLGCTVASCRLGHLELRLKPSNLAAKVEILHCKMPTADIVTSEGWLTPKRQLDETETAGFYVHETCVDYAQLTYMT